MAKKRAGNNDIVIALDRSTGIKVANRAKRITDAAQQVVACTQGMPEEDVLAGAVSTTANRTFGTLMI
ncbi:MAG TPA: hypothetical protein VNI77_03200 [Nitrososphaera sp.]|nr:hypothetical protein [Nitrososphaera sp.]